MSNEHIEQTVSVYNTIADSYVANTENYYSPREREAFLTSVPKGGKILDVGCAGGRDSRYFDTQGYNVTGVDLSEKFIGIAKKKAPHIDFQIQDVRNLQFPKESFDGIYASAVLLHLKRDEVLPALKQFHALLKPGGTLGIQVKEGKGEGHVQEKLSGGKARYFTFFQKEEIEHLLKDAGFANNTVHRYNEQDINPNWRNLVWLSCLSKK